MDELECRALLATISGFVYNDFDGDGSRDAEETGLSDVTVYLDQNLNGTLDPGEASRVSDGSGFYSFSSLDPGAYFVRQIDPPGQTRTEPVGNFHYVPLSGGQDAVRNFGNQSAEANMAPILGQVFHDLNSNGVKEADEPGISGWTVFVDLDNNAMPGSGEPSTTTDSEGNYRLLVSPGRVYQVREDVPEGWALTAPSLGFHIVPVFSTRPALGRDFGNEQLGAGDDEGVLSGQVFDDQDVDGEKDAGEPGLAGWTVYLDLEKDGVLDASDPSTTTDASGNYSFTVEPGSYQVREVVQENWQQTAPVGGVHDVTVGPGQTLDDLDFGNVRTAGSTVSGTVFHDNDPLNSRRDPSEDGLEGWIVYADLDGDRSFDEGVEPSTLSGPNGQYSLSLEPGTYQIREVVQAGWVQTAPTRRFHDVTLGSGQSVTGLDFGNFNLSPQSSMIPPPGSNGEFLGAREGGTGAGAVTELDGTRQGDSSDTSMIDLAIPDLDASGFVLQTGTSARQRVDGDNPFGSSTDESSPSGASSALDVTRSILKPAIRAS